MRNDGHPDLEQPVEPEHDSSEFAPGSDSVPTPVDPSYDERLATFERDIEDLKAEWEPFLADHVPEAPQTRSVRELEEFDFRSERASDRQDFDLVLEGEGDWERVALPDYRGPVGDWTGFYRTEFDYDTPAADRVYLRFEAVDYVATVYLNGRCVATHEGFFAPFEVDVTDHLRETGNRLLVEVENKVPIDPGGPDAPDYDGEKLFADAGLGWDDPEIGWHQHTAGAGIRGAVTLEERPSVHVADAFVRTCSDGAVEARIEVRNATDEPIDTDIDLTVYPRNFDGDPVDCGVHSTATADPGGNEYRIRLNADPLRGWSPDKPWMYALRIDLPGDGRPVDTYDVDFGVRRLEMETDGTPKGRLSLDGEPLALRGVNCPEHLAKAAFDGEEDQIVEDLLIAKYANANFLRLTQRPLPEVVYEYCDRLGLLTQTDLPLSGGLRRGKFVQGVDQAAEMERLIRGHPSAAMVSFVNEPQGTEPRGLEHRRLDREEFGRFVDAATAAVRLRNPDRIVKPGSGSVYPLASWLPPVEGLPDFHTYTMWYYGGHLGPLHAGELPTVTKRGWMTGVGEYGAEGLDSLELMRSRYPDDWLPADPDDSWAPDRIAQCQTYEQHVLWYDEPDTLSGWIEASQRHQARMVRTMTDAFRRRADRVVSIAVYFLIDAWPAGWMKALVDANRTPKRGYFALKDSFKPRRVNLRTDRGSLYAGETAEIDAWLLNDRPTPLEDYEIRVSVRMNGDELERYVASTVGVDGVASERSAVLRFEIPEVTDREAVHVDAGLYDADGALVDSEREIVEAFARPDPSDAVAVKFLGDEPPTFSEAGIEVSMYDGGTFETLLVESPAAFERYREAVLEGVADGGRAIFLPTGGEGEWELDGTTVSTRPVAGFELTEPHHEEMPEFESGLPFVARNEDEPETAAFERDDFGFWYNGEADRRDLLTDTVLEGDDLVSLLYTWETDGSDAADTAKRSGSKTRLPVVARRAHGDGSLVFCELRLDGRVGNEPVLDRFLRALVTTSV